MEDDAHDQANNCCSWPRSAPGGDSGWEKTRSWPQVAGGLVAKSCQTLAIPWTVSRQAPLSMGFSRDAISFSRGSSQSRNQTQVSCIAGRFFTDWATREDQYMVDCITYSHTPNLITPSFVSLLWQPVVCFLLVPFLFLINVKLILLISTKSFIEFRQELW